MVVEVCDIARKAGRAIMDVYHGEYHVEFKEDSSPLTTADQASHRVITAGLKKLFPDIPVISEEGKDIPFSERVRWKRFWLIDPLDGTKEFIKKNGEFTVNIALIEDFRAVVGVIYVPAQDLLYYASKGGGAWRQYGAEPPSKLPLRTLPFDDGFIVVRTRSHSSDRLNNFLAMIDVKENILVGSSLKFCLVAEGRAHLYPRLGPTCEWDTSAGQAIVEEAGGIVVDWQSRPILYNKDKMINSDFLVLSEGNLLDLSALFPVKPA